MTVRPQSRSGRRATGTAAAALLALGFALDAAAQPYPGRAIRIVVPFPAGGPTDVVSRLTGQKLGERLGQSVVIENRPGAGGVIGTDFVVKSAPDGYTLVMGTIGGLSVSQHLLRKMPYDTLRDLAPITQVVSNTNFMVLHPSVPVKTVQEFVALARKQPGALVYASSGNGTITHLSGELFKMLTGVAMTHVPYKGGAPALTALLSGEVALSFENALVALPHIRAGKMRAIAVTGAKRTQALPQVPTMEEAGIEGYQATGWYGLLAPAATPKEIVDRLHAEMVQVLRTKEVQDKLAAMGSDAIGNSPAEFAAFIRAESEKWGKVVRSAGMKPD